MTKPALLLRLCLFALAAFGLAPALAQKSQIVQPVRWSIRAEPAQAQVGDEVDLVFEAAIIADWYLYSSDFSPELGPQVSEFEFAPHASYALVEGLRPIKPKKKYDDLWEGEYTYFVGKGEFRQRVKVLAPEPRIAVAFQGQACTDVSGKCIPLSEDFLFDASVLQVAGKPAAETPKNAETAASDPKKPESSRPAETAQPEESSKGTPAEGAPAETPPARDSTAPEPRQEARPEAGKRPEADAAGQFSASQNASDIPLLAFLISAFLAGITAIFTPCVFPMVPLTVSFFSNKKGKTGAFVYGGSIVLIYALLGAITVPFVGHDAANALSTHWLPNAIFFAIFIAFALSFFGMFDITLPAGFVNRMDRMADQKGGFAGIFFMAFTLTLVSFSCTGPLVGTLLVASARGEVLRPVLGMATFGTAFALPFVVFALFPRLLQGLPKSGGWLNGVKVTLGFIELALAFKFLSMIDLVYHLGLLDRDLNIAIWIGIFTFMALYYLGKIQLPHDSPVEKISVPRMLLALLSFTFVVYLIPGLFGAPLKALSGVLPPSQTHDFDLHRVVREQSGGAGPAAGAPAGGKKYADLFHFPHGFSGYFDYQEGLEAARKLGKPVMLDFTGHGCANCRKMEDNVWVDPQVRQRLERDWVIVELYVDDRTLLPESEWYTSSYDGKVKKTIGAANMDLEVSRFGNNAQPLYVLLDHRGGLLADGMGYDPDPARFAAFLDAGLAEFRQRQGR